MDLDPKNRALEWVIWPLHGDDVDLPDLFYLHAMRVIALIVFSFVCFPVFAQQKGAIVSGVVVDENDLPLAKVSVTLLGRISGVVTNDSGYFKISVPSNKAVALVFTSSGFNEVQQNFYLSEGEVEKVIIRLEKGQKTLQNVTVSDSRERIETGLTKINPKSSVINPSPVGGVEGLIKSLVGSTNELSSQYSVRGGSYDENLIYINDFEIFRPFLVRSGQQEGLSFINPELARNVSFYTGGFQAKYGDKLSSVLDIQYKKPSTLAGSAYASLLEQGGHIEGSARNQSITFLLGIRNKTNNNLLSSQATKGSYIPTSSDIQAYVTWQVRPKWQLELLGNYAITRFSLIPESVQKTASVYSPLFTSNLGLDIAFEGQEQDRYSTSFVGLTAINQVNKKLKLKWMISRFEDKEKEQFDIAATYLFGDRDFDNNSSTFGQIVNALGAGAYQNYARNDLSITVWNAAVKGILEKGKHYLQFGNSIEQTDIQDKVYEWEYQDSAGYSLPLNSNLLSAFINNTSDLSIQKFSGYVQDNLVFKNDRRDITLQAGVRYQYNTLNKELLISPRFQLSLKPVNQNVVYKFAAGIYQQPPFFRELRKPNGQLNEDVLAQKSVQFVAGLDYQFANSKRPFRLTAELYYKNMWDVVTYDIDNVRTRYAGFNNAKAYAYGIETRLYGELVKDAESWLSVGFMKTREDIEGDRYFDYKNAAGEIITAQTADKVVKDSVVQDVGYLRRPTDRLITVGLFLQDYLSTNKNFRVHLNMIYGSNMPYNIPNSVRYRNGLIIDPYIRVDIGFSALLLGEKNKRRSHSPFRTFDNIWASLEVFNLIDRPNTISYQLIKDFSNSIYSIPNRLTPRLLNFKLLARF